LEKTGKKAMTTRQGSDSRIVELQSVSQK
jgi:hypothetical protein